MAYPSVISTISNPQASDRLNNPSHSSIHQAENTAITEIETFVGTLSSTVGTLVYDIRAATSNGGGHVQSANKGGTGQTSFNKGDLLVAQSSSVIAKLGVGIDGATLLADSTQAAGVKWGNATSNTQSFISSGVWYKPSIVSQIFVQLWAGGGSGGQSSIANVVGGGGGGGYVEGYLNPSIVSSSVIVGIGAGGLGVTGADGNPGGNTVFDTVTSLLTAYGGGGGAEAAVGTGGAGGGGGGGTYAQGGSATTTTGGAGGASGWVGASSMFSSGGGTAAGGNPSTAQNAFYSAGGGANAGSGGNAVYGGAGGGGAVSSALGIAGISQFGGNGTAGSVLTAASMAAAARPGGGGGGAYGTGATSSAGGGGKAIITAIT